MDPNEMVLVVPTQSFHNLYSKWEQTNVFSRIGVSLLLSPAICEFKTREEVENDPTWKQIIPYVIIHHKGKILTYERGVTGGEKRLVGKISIGVGGHINPPDTDDQSGNGMDLLINAALREMDEEVYVESEGMLSIAGVISDDSNAVGSVHLGIVLVLDMTDDKISKREDQVVCPYFEDVSILKKKRENMETWSQICLDNIETLLSSALKNPDKEKIINGD